MVELKGVKTLVRNDPAQTIDIQSRLSSASMSIRDLPMLGDEVNRML